MTHPRPPQTAAILSLALAASACDATAPAGPRVAVSVAPLTLPGIVEACYDLRVTNAPGGAGDTVWERDDLCSTRYGDGGGALAYVGPCDGDAPGPNTVLLSLARLEDAGGAVAFANPCPAAAPCRREVACVADADAAVSFDLTIARPAQQGFFDVAVSFDDLFCSAKVDCVTATPGGDAPLELLQPPGESGRVPTVVLAVACTAGAGADTQLWLDDVDLVCGGATVTIPVSGPPGNVWSTTSPPPPPLLQAATYRGVEQLTDGSGASWAKLYANLAFAVDLDAVPAACDLETTVTASDGAFDPLFATPAGTAYPVLRVDVPIAGGPGASAYACTRHPIGDAAADGVWTAYTALSAPELFEHRVYAQAGAAVVEDRVPLAIAPATIALDPGEQQTFSASAGVPPYSYSLVSGGGSLAGATYTAPATATNAVVRVTDALGATSDAAVTVNITYATLDPAATSAGVALTGDLLQASNIASTQRSLATVGLTSGKWYWEVTYVGQVGGSLAAHCYLEAGVSHSLGASNRWYYQSYFQANPDTFCRNYRVDYTTASTFAGTGVTVGGTVGLRLDLGAGTLDVRLNGGAFVPIGTNITGTVYPHVGNIGYGGKLIIRANFGADLVNRPFLDPVPPGFNPGVY